MALDESVTVELDYLSKRLGVSKSALVNEILKESLPTMSEVFRLIPDAPTPEDVVRFRGESAKIVQQRLDFVKRTSPDLFGE